MVIVEIVIDAEVLVVGQAMIQLQSELVGAFRLHRCSHKCAVIVGWGWDVLEKVYSRGVKTTKWNDVVRKQVGIQLAIRDGWGVAQGSGAVWALIQRKGACQSAREY